MPIRQELRRHKKAYLALAIGLLSLGGLFFLAWPDRAQQRWLALALILFYFFWGVTTHVKTERLTPQVVLEYLAVSLLAGLLLFLITF